MYSGPPFLTEGSLWERRQRCAQAAEQTMQHLAHYGSEINKFSFEPQSDTIRYEDIDGDGNSCPYYSHKRAPAVVKHAQVQGVQGVKTTVTPQSGLGMCATKCS